jgi:hypothetical protein
LKCSLPIEIPDARYDRILRRRIFKPRSSTWRWMHHCPPKRLYPTTTLHGVATDNTST